LNMPIRVAINGFGRIGRCVFRAGFADPEIEFVHINDLTDDKTLAHLLKYDSVHGKFENPTAVDGGIKVGDTVISTSATRDPSDLPWAEKNIDVVLECTGFFRTSETAQKHIDAGAKKVIISAPAKSSDVRTIVVGVNDGDLQVGDTIVSNASCTTNCLAPVAKVLDEVFGIESGLMTTVHAFTGDQRLVDAPHSDLRRGRAAAVSMVPTSTGAAKAVALVYPQMKGKLTGIAMRVPTPNVSAVDLVFESGRKTSAEEVNSLLKTASQGEMKGIIKYGDLPLVSTDYAGTNESTIVDEALTMCIDDNMVKVLAWYDNEWGYSQRVVDLAEIVAQKWK
jgi:glyceraldehyde-3-phosphate dehydrogenase (NAD(P))